MDIAIITEVLKDNPGSYFIAGLIVGYYLRNFVSHYRVKRPGRYQAEANRISNEKHADSSPASHEPYFDWADAAVKSLTSRQNNMSLDQRGKEV